MIFIRDIERSQNRESSRVHRVGLLRYRSHLGVHVFSKFEDVLRIRAAKIVGLIEDLDAHAAFVSVLGSRLFGGARHNLFRSLLTVASILADQLAACSSASVSICCSIFSTRPRISSRSLRNCTISRRRPSTSSSRSSSCSRSRCASRSDAARASRAALYISIVR